MPALLSRHPARQRGRLTRARPGGRGSQPSHEDVQGDRLPGLQKAHCAPPIPRLGWRPLCRAAASVKPALAGDRSAAEGGAGAHPGGLPVLGANKDPFGLRNREAGFCFLQLKELWLI